MTNQEIYDLIARFDHSSLQTLRLSKQDFSIELSRNSAQSPAPSAPAAAQSPVPAPAAPARDRKRENQTYGKYTQRKVQYVAAGKKDENSSKKSLKKC